MPVTIIAGAADKIVDADAHSVGLHAELVDGRLMVQPGVGHMVHYAAPDKIAAVIDLAADAAAAQAPAPAPAV